MLNVLTQPTQSHFPQPALSGSDAADRALLDSIGPLTDARILLLGPNALEMMCALIRSDCASVTALRPADRSAAASAEIAIVMQAASPEYVDQMLVQARWALVPLGSVVLRLPAIAPVSLLRHVARSLRLHGFSAVRTRTLANHIVLSAELPLLGRLTAAYA